MDRKSSISVPQRGEKRELVEQVLANAREAHGRNLAETASQARLLQGLAETFNLAHPRGASRSTTTPTSWAPMPWAA
jgi:excinuclease ABC subunit C